MTAEETNKPIETRHDDLLRELALLRSEAEADGDLSARPQSLLDFWRNMLEDARAFAEEPVEIPFIAQVGRGKSTLIAAAAGLRLDVQGLPRDWSVLPVDRGRTTLGVVELRFEERADIEVRMECWPTAELEREIQLVAEDTWAIVHRPADAQLHGQAGMELKELVRGWLSTQPGADVEDEEVLERMAGQHPDVATFVAEVMARVELSSREARASRLFRDDPPGREALKTFLSDLMRGRAAGLSAPLVTRLHLPRRHAPEGVDALIDTQGLEANAQGLLIDAREDILTYTDNPTVPLVVCSAFEDAPDVVSQGLLQRAIQQRKMAFIEGMPRFAPIVLVVVDRDGTAADASGRKARDRKRRQCGEGLQRLLGDAANDVKIEFVNAQSEASALVALLARMAATTRQGRRARWTIWIEEAERAIEPLRTDATGWPRRLRALDLRLEWEREAGLAQADRTEAHPLELLAGVIQARDAQHVQHWSHLNATARRRGRYRKLDLAALTGRLTALHYTIPLFQGAIAARQALEDKRIVAQGSQELSHAQMRVDRMTRTAWEHMQILRRQVTEQVAAWFMSEQAESLWSRLRERWGQGPGYVSDFAAILREQVPGAKELRLASEPRWEQPGTHERPGQLLIRRVTFENFRLFGQLDLDLDRTSVIVGENGAGKTTTLDGIAALLVPFVAHLADNDVPPLHDRDVRVETFEGPETPLLAPPEPLELEIRAEFEGARIAWTRRATRQNRMLFEEGGWEDLVTLAAAVREELRRPTNRQLPLIAYYRLERREMGALPPDFDQAMRESRQDGYRHAMRAGLDYGLLVQWVRKHTYAALQRKRKSHLLDGIERAVRASVPGVRSFTYDIASEELQVVMKTGRAYPLAVLSSGYQSIIALVADIAWRACVLNPQLLDLAPALTEGVVLIDEIDLHLHPRWQRRVLPDLRRAFPRLQFIVTTHSPQVIASADPTWIRVLRADDQVGSVEHSLGVDSNTLLREVFDDGGYPRETIERIGEVRARIAAGDLGGASKLVDDLERDLGEMADNVRTLRWELAEASLDEE